MLTKEMSESLKNRVSEEAVDALKRLKQVSIEIPEMRRIRHIHFIGIGGVGMAAVDLGKHLGAKVIATACPFCMVMMSDGVKAFDKEEEVETEDDEAESQMHTVVSGDTLWKIAKKYYGNGSRYPEIFEANRPMLTHPDKIYVGQVLRIPADKSDAGVA